MRNAAALSALVSVFALIAPQQAAAQQKLAHLREVACEHCHVFGAPADAVQAKALVASQEVLCGECHADAVRLMHPTGIVPKLPLPVGFPVDAKGELTCSSCHAPHGNTPGLLRDGRRGRQLCLDCHDAAFFEGMKDGGFSIDRSAHLTGGIQQATAEIDPYSLQCMSCHDGYGMAGETSVGPRGLVTHGKADANHPIGRRYADAAGGGMLQPASRLAREIVLPGGKIGCVSCHQAYKKEHGRLVVANRGSALCLQCHQI